MELEAQLQASAVDDARSRGGRRRVPREARGALRGTLTRVARPRLRLIVNPVASTWRERTVRTVLRGARAALRRRAGRDRSATGTRSSSPPRPSPLGFDGVGAMGGDGTANEVLNGAGDALPVGVLPGRRDERAAARAAACRATSARPPAQVADGARRRGASGASTSASSTAGASRSPPAWAPTRRPCGSSTSAGRPRGRRPGDAYFAAQIMRTLLRGDFREPQLEVCLNGEVVARGVQHLRRQRASLELRRPVRAQARAARDVRGRARRRRAERHAPAAPAALRDAAARHGQPGAPPGQAARLPARRRRRARARAAGRCRCTPTATISAMSRRSSSASRATPRGCSCDAAAAVRPRRHARGFACRRRAAVGRAVRSASGSTSPRCSRSCTACAAPT